MDNPHNKLYSEFERYIDDINILAEFLAIRDINNLTKEELKQSFGIHKADILILLGNSITYTAEQAAKILNEDMTDELMIVGGIGHSTKLLRDNIINDYKYGDINVLDRAEADILKNVIIKNLHKPFKDIIIENRSTNCGDNAIQALKVLKNLNKTPENVILLQDPTMQLRSFASFKKVFKGEKVKFINYSPFIPKVAVGQNGLEFENKDVHGIWDMDRFLSLIMGEIPRLQDDENGYGPKGKGFIEHVEIPIEVKKAYERCTRPFEKFLKARNI